MNSIIPLLGELVPTLRREAGVGLLKKLFIFRLLIFLFNKQNYQTLNMFNN